VNAIGMCNACDGRLMLLSSQCGSVPEYPHALVTDNPGMGGGVPPRL